MLYRRSYLGRWLKCITLEDGDRIIREVHEGLCGSMLVPGYWLRKLYSLGTSSQPFSKLLKHCAKLPTLSISCARTSLAD